ALMKACGITGAVVAPAFPQAGRTTVAGECWVNGVRITETEFASDPKTPVLSARIADIIRLQTAIPCQPVTVSQLSHLSYEQPWISVIDAQTDSDLDRIAAAVMQAKQPLLLVGSAGICDAVARRSAIMPPPTVLAIIGSMSEIAQR
ncbi:four-carbon acid sugar kinase family protein, partial [Escherichia coli]